MHKWQNSEVRWSIVSELCLLDGKFSRLDKSPALSLTIYLSTHFTFHPTNIKFCPKGLLSKIIFCIKIISWIISSSNPKCGNKSIRKFGYCVLVLFNNFKLCIHYHRHQNRHFIWYMKMESISFELNLLLSNRMQVQNRR